MTNMSDDELLAGLAEALEEEDPVPESATRLDTDNPS